MPTLCVFNGHAVAGGLFLGLAHDFRILKDKSFVSLSEILIGVGMGPAWTALLNVKLQTQVVRLMIYGLRYKSA